MSESTFQRKLIKEYEAQGFHVIKLIQANKAGYPDLLCLMPERVLFVEVKSRTGKLSKVQEYRHAELRAAGFDVQTIHEELTDLK